MKSILFIITIFTLNICVSQNALQDLSSEERQSVLQRTSVFNIVDSQALLQIDDVNQVFIQQVGEGNEANTTVISSKSNVIINQNGKNNTAYSFYRAGTINSELVQDGFSNSFFEIVNGNSSQEVNSVNSQIGDNLTLNKFGSNTISNNISINMTGSNKTISVFSF